MTDKVAITIAWRNTVRMRETTAHALRIQLEEAIQMLRLVATEKRTCVEVAEWLDRNYPDNEDVDQGKPIVTMLLKSKDEK